MVETEPRSASFVAAETHEGVRVLALRNPPVNALSLVVSSELLAQIDAAEADAGIVAVVITGSNGIFSAGADIADFLSEPSPMSSPRSSGARKRTSLRSTVTRSAAASRRRSPAITGSQRPLQKWDCRRFCSD
jgi:enoyl-CoA hydratase/carnithine racemase